MVFVALMVLNAEIENKFFNSYLIKFSYDDFFFDFDCWNGYKLKNQLFVKVFSVITTTFEYLNKINISYQNSFFIEI